VKTTLFALLLPCIAAAQLQIYFAPPGNEVPIGTSYDMGSTPVGEITEARFRVRNQGSAAVALTTLHVSGVGFTMLNKPSLPYTIAPGLNVDFTIVFRPHDYGDFSADIKVNGTGVMVRGKGSAAAMVRVDGTPVSANATIDMGRVERGSAARKTFEVFNASSLPVGVTAVGVEGSGLRVEWTQAPPWVLQPGASASFDVVFEPPVAAVYAGTLRIDQRSYRITGASMEPPMLRPSVVIDAIPTGSAQQGKVAVRFGSPSRASGPGRLRIDFEPAAPARDNDSTIVFAASGSRTIPFTVSEGDSAAKFGNAFEAVFQTGTTAGTIVLTAETGGYTEQARVTIAGAPVRLDSVRAARNGSMLEVIANGFDNTQAGSTLSFVFYDGSGRPLTPEPLRADAGADFRRYFESATLGGAFSLRAVFPVAGDTSQISAVEVEMANPAGTTRSERIRF
jgi:hypothetical protein